MLSEPLITMKILRVTEVNLEPVNTMIGSIVLHDFKKHLLSSDVIIAGTL